METDLTLPRRARDSYKGDYGRLLIIGGCVGYTGAPNLCASAAVRCGAGLVSLGVPEPIYSICAVKQDSAMPFPLPAEDGKLSALAIAPILERLEHSDVCVLGPGLGRSDALTQLVQTVIRETPIPLVLDADALFAAAQAPEVLLEAGAPVILTPHEGEFARFRPERFSDRVEETAAFSLKYRCTVVRKGPETVCAFPDGSAARLRVGNPGMVKGGSGDVLAGMLGAFLCQKQIERPAETAVWVHGQAGDRCAQRLGEYAMTPSDLIDAIPEVTKQMTL